MQQRLGLGKVTTGAGGGAICAGAIGSAVVADSNDIVGTNQDK